MIYSRSYLMSKRKTKIKKRKEGLKKAKAKMIENFELNYQKELKRRRIEQSKSIKEKTYCSDKSDTRKKKREIKELQKKFSIQSYDKIGGEYKK